MTPQGVSRDLFERRMRQRRAATCVAAARACMADGRTLEAVERLEEACRLDPDALEARLLLEQIRADEPADVPELVPGEAASAEAGFGKWSHWVAAVVAVGALAALALLRQPATDESRDTPTRERDRPAIGAEAPAAAQAVAETGPPETTPGPYTVPLVIEPTEAPTIVASAALGAPPVSSDSRGGAVGTGGSAATPQRLGADPPTTARSAPAGGAAADVSGWTVVATATGAVPPGIRPVEVAGAGEAPLAPPPPVQRPAVMGAGGEPPRVAGDATRTTDIAASLAGATTTAAPPASPTQAGANSAAPTSPLVPAGGRPLPAAEDASRLTPAARAADPTPASYRARDEEEEIGRTLRLYVDAYVRLDASAARKVWPTVDERALARAFAGLQSQGISFERCETEVNGSEAHAVCRGRAKYVPKVGSREPLTSSRQWTFRLRRAGDGWQIASADVR